MIEPLTPEEFREAQAKLGLNNAELAAALEIGGASGDGVIVRFRSGQRKPAIRVSQLMRLWTDPRVPADLKPKGKRST